MVQTNLHMLATTRAQHARLDTPAPPPMLPLNYALPVSTLLAVPFTVHLARPDPTVPRQCHRSASRGRLTTVWLDLQFRNRPNTASAGRQRAQNPFSVVQVTTGQAIHVNLAQLEISAPSTQTT